MGSSMIKGKLVTILKSHKCQKSLKSNLIKPSLIKRLINFNKKSSNSKNSESKKKTTTKMVQKHSLIKSKLKSITLTLLKLVS